MRQRTAWYWNGRHGHLDRRDVIVWRRGDTWSVEDRAGGDGGGSKIITAMDEDDAVVISRHLVASDETLRDVRGLAERP